MKDSKKGINYKVNYKTLKAMVTEELEKNRVFATKKERKEAVRGALKEVRQAFNESVASHLQNSLESGIEKYTTSLASEAQKEETTPEQA